MSQRQCFFLTVVAILTAALCIGVWRATAPAPQQANEAGVAEIDKLIESLANHNIPPRKITVNGPGAEVHIPEYLPGTYPLYPDNNDWSEDQRVRDVVKKISKQSPEAVWWRLVQHEVDKSYAIAFTSEGHAHIATIGDLCWEKAYWDLVNVFHELPPENVSRQLIPIHGRDGLMEWYRGHKDVPLYEQQIELGKIVLERTEKLETLKSEQEHDFAKVRSQDKSELLDEIKKIIGTLERTKKPILSPGDIFWNRFDDPHFGNPDGQKTFREQYRAQTNQAPSK